MTVDATDVDKANAPGLDRIGEWALTKGLKEARELGAPG